jgi:hypothetical protein
LAVEGLAAGANEHDIARFELVSEACQRTFDLRGLDLFAVGLVRHVDNDDVGKEPFQW